MVEKSSGSPVIEVQSCLMWRTWSSMSPHCH
jgi:hypothetical protein